jgi:hypothetical protein
MIDSHSIGCIAPWSTRGPVSALFRNFVMPRPSTYASSTFITVMGPTRTNISETRSTPGRSQMVLVKGSQGSGRSRNRPEPSITAVPTPGTPSAYAVSMYRPTGAGTSIPETRSRMETSLPPRSVGEVTSRTIRAFLRHVAEPDTLLGADALPRPAHLTAIETDQTEDRPHRGRLARAVRTEEPYDSTRGRKRPRPTDRVEGGPRSRPFVATRRVPWTWWPRYAGDRCSLTEAEASTREASRFPAASTASGERCGRRPGRARSP